MHFRQPKIAGRMASRRGLEPLTPGLGNNYIVLFNWCAADHADTREFTSVSETGLEVVYELGRTGLNGRSL
jgi:hypothetical protein